MHIVRICALSIAITQGLHHNAQVCEPICGCDCGFRDVRAMCARDVTSDFHSVLMERASQNQKEILANLYQCVTLYISYPQQSKFAGIEKKFTLPLKIYKMESDNKVRFSY